MVGKSKKEFALDTTMHKVFDRRRYTLFTGYRTKKAAMRNAGLYRADGTPTRVLKVPGGYAIYLYWGRKK